MKCDCENWVPPLPPGYICGKPGCPRTVAANKDVNRMLRYLFPQPWWKRLIRWIRS